MSQRNNEERLGAKVDSPAPPPQQLNNSSNEPFSFVTPTEFVELPSRGVFYPPNHPLHNVESVEIRYMTAKDEDILTSRSLLKKGIAIDRLLDNLLVDKNVRSNNILIGDKNALIIAARSTGYGNGYETKVMCPVCYTNVEHSFDLDELNFIYPDNLEELGVELTEDRTFLITLPKMEATVEVRLLTGADERTLSEKAERLKKLNMPESTMTDQFREFIVSVNGNSDRAIVNRLIDNMPAKDSRFLRNLYAKVTPNVDLERVVTCPSCAVENELVIPFSAAFFWPK